MNLKSTWKLHRRRERPTDDVRGGSEDPGKRRKDLTALIGLVAAVLVLVGAMLEAGTLDFLSDGPVTKSDIRLGQVEPRNGEVQQTAISSDQPMTPTRATIPQIDITVTNSGDEPGMVERARVTILDSTSLGVCFTRGAGGEFPISIWDTVTLPVSPVPDERTVVRDLHLAVPPDGDRRMQLLFEEDVPAVAGNLFAFRVDLITDDPGHISVGRFVMAVPKPISRLGQILPEDSRTVAEFDNLSRRSRLVALWCLRRNMDEVARLVGQPGMRSEEVAALSDLYVAPEWKAISETLDPRSSIEVLMRERVFGGPTLVMYAARQSRDQDLIERTKRRLSSKLLRKAEDDMEDFATSAVQAAREAYRILPTARALEVLSRAKGIVGEQEREMALTEASE